MEDMSKTYNQNYKIHTKDKDCATLDNFHPRFRDRYNCVIHCSHLEKQSTPYNNRLRESNQSSDF